MKQSDNYWIVMLLVVMCMGVALLASHYIDKSKALQESNERLQNLNIDLQAQTLLVISDYETIKQSLNKCETKPYQVCVNDVCRYLYSNNDIGSMMGQKLDNHTLKYTLSTIKRNHDLITIETEVTAVVIVEGGG